MQESTLSPQNLSIKDISKLIGISTQTLRNWESYFNIVIERNEYGQRIYTENTFKFFKEINDSVKRGLKLKEIKASLNMDFEPYNEPQGKIEVITNEPVFDQNIDLILKPYTDRIKQLESIENKYISMAEDNATLKERVKNKDEIISMLNYQLAEHKARKWWQIWQ